MLLSNHFNLNAFSILISVRRYSFGLGLYFCPSKHVEPYECNYNKKYWHFLSEGHILMEENANVNVCYKSKHYKRLIQWSQLLILSKAQRTVVQLPLFVLCQSFCHSQKSKGSELQWWILWIILDYKN